MSHDEEDDALFRRLREAAPRLSPERAGRLARNALALFDAERKVVLRLTWAASMAASVLALVTAVWLLQNPSTVERTTSEVGAPAELAAGVAAQDTAAQNPAGLELSERVISDLTVPEMAQALVSDGSGEADPMEAMLLAEETVGDEVILGFLAGEWREP